VSPTPLADERISTAVGKIQLWRGGHGDALVYLHSAAGEAAATAVLEDLADSFSVTAPMFPGFGESEGMDEIDDMEDAAFHLLDIWDQLGLTAPAVVGTSLGGWMAAELATRNPEKVGSLVLVNPAGLHVEGAPVGEIFGRPPDELARDLFADESHPFVVAADQMAQMTTMKVDPPFELVRPMLQSLAATAKVAWNPYLHNPRLRRRLHRISAPTLVVHGAQDRLSPRAHAEAYAAGIPGARLVDVEGAGHMLPLEKAAELAALVRGHVTRSG
jgi:pimeloyl-ACP methyl ester carboxylesterase